MLPETAHEGAEVFRARVDDRVRGYLSERGVKIDGTEVPATALTFPGDDDPLVAVRADFERIDATQHR